jgi:hypothetical protein
MDKNDPAWKLAEAAQAMLKGDLDAMDRALAEVKPTTQDVAKAHALCLTTAPYSGSEATRLIVNSLQYAVAEKTAHKLNVLTGWLVALTVLLAIFGGFDIIMRLRGCG